MRVQSQFIEMFVDVEKKPFVDVCISKGEYGSNSPADDYDGNIRYVRITDITEEGNLNGVVVSPRKVEEKYMLLQDDLLFARTGNTVGKTYLHKSGKMVFAGYLIRYRLNKKLMLPQFAFAYTHTNQYYDWVEKIKKVGAQPNISAAQYDSMPIPVPSMAKQIEFVAIAKQADKSKFDGFKSQFIEMFTNKGYPLKALRTFAEISTGSTPSKKQPQYWENGDKPWVSAQDMKCKYVSKTEEWLTDMGFSKCKILPVDTLMYVCRGSIGVMAINKIECATNQSICSAICDKSKCNVDFLYHSLLYKKDSIKSIGEGTSFKSLSQSTFADIKIELPPIVEQNRFVSIAKQADKSKYNN